MIFLNWPSPLWFLRGGGPVAASVDVCVSTLYNVTASIGGFNSIDIELSSFAYNITASTVDPPDDSEYAPSILAALNLDGDTYQALTARVTATPVFVLDQFGIVEFTATTTCNLTVSAGSASVLADNSVSVTYKVSASASAAILTAELFSASLLVQVTTSMVAFLSKTQSSVDVNINSNYFLTASTTPILRIGKQGGLVWKRKSHRYIPVRIGSVGFD